MGLLKKAKNQTAYAKIGVFGFSGAGKTYTSSMLAMGISKTIANGKPVAFLDTETGSDYMIPKFEAEGIELLVLKSRAFKDLLQVIREAEKECSVLIIDSLTHIWTDLTDSYLASRRQSRLQFQDWGPIKKEWGRYTRLFLNSKIHIIACGRAGYEYDTVTNEDGKKEIIKGNTKFKAEGEFGFEPSFVIEMTMNREKDKNQKISSKFDHVALVLKDRSDKLNGHVLKNPTFKSFRPYFDFLNIGGEHLGVADSDSQEIFEPEGESFYKKQQRISILLDEIQSGIVHCFPGATALEKKVKSEVIDQVFGTTSWEKVKSLPEGVLDTGKRMIGTLRKNFDAYEGNPPTLETAKTFVAGLLTPTPLKAVA